MKQVIGLSEIVRWVADKASRVYPPCASGRIVIDQWLARDGGAELSAARSVAICTIWCDFYCYLVCKMETSRHEGGEN